MASIDPALVGKGVHTLLREIFDGADPRGGWILNRGDPGFLAGLEAFTAEQASAKPIPGRSSLAGHVQHLRYAFELLNRWSRGEENVFESADWEGSWRPQTVSGDEWRSLREGLASEAHAWMETARARREWDAVAVTGALSSAAHAAYHLGAVRQLAGLLEAAG